MSKINKIHSSFEHHSLVISTEIDKNELVEHIAFKGDYKRKCLEISLKNISSSYYVGLDWIDTTRQNAIYVMPKSISDNHSTDYLKMLDSILKHSECLKYVSDCYEIKTDTEFIEIEREDDLLTPLLLIQFLRVVQEIVRKGLKKSYYKVNQNLNGRVKGKILISKTINQNIVKNKPIYTFCEFEEFGINTIENKLLKKALLFAARCLPDLGKNTTSLTDIFNYIQPAFQSVDCDIEVSQVKQIKTNLLYKEYDEAIRLAKIILKRFGYTIKNVEKTEKGTIKTPPFWIDMSKLFELYVLSLLKDKFGKDIKYHVTVGKANELDFLLNTNDLKMVIDAKYKAKYQIGLDTQDMRQVSGYARLSKIYERLGISKDVLIDCLIIYPDQNEGKNDFEDFVFKEIDGYEKMYKIAVKIPFNLAKAQEKN